MGDISKLPKWAQEYIRTLVNRVDHLEWSLARREQDWNKENERSQERLEVIEECAKLGIPCAVKYVDLWYKGEVQE